MIFNDDNPKCPYCGHESELCGDEPPEGEFECYGCERTYFAYPEYSVSFHSICADDKHEYEERVTESREKIRQCKNCEKIQVWFKHKDEWTWI